MNAKLDVPLIRQTEDSLECGLATIAMIYAYHNIPMTMEQLRTDLSLNAIGTFAPQLGIHVLQHGLNAEIINHNPKLIGFDDRAKTQEELLEKFRAMEKNSDTNDKLALNYFIKFVELGGIVTPKIPSPDDIREEINKGNPLFAILHTGALYENKKSFNEKFHIVVIIGIDDQFVYLNDPFWGPEGGQTKYPIHDFFFALAASSLGDLDNGSLVKIYKRV